MQYKINKTNYCTFEVYKDNKLDGRSYFIPYPSKKSADEVSPKEKRYKSPKVICLNGLISADLMRICPYLSLLV